MVRSIRVLQTPYFLLILRLNKYTFLFQTEVPSRYLRFFYYFCIVMNLILALILFIVSPGSSQIAKSAEQPADYGWSQASDVRSFPCLNTPLSNFFSSEDSAPTFSLRDRSSQTRTGSGLKCKYKIIKSGRVFGFAIFKHFLTSYNLFPSGTFSVGRYLLSVRSLRI